MLAAAAVAGVRWMAAGEPVPIAAPTGASTVLPEGGYTVVVDNRTSEVFTDLRNDRGVPEVETYAMPPATTWDQVRSGIAGQLGGWKQVGDCADTGERRVTCSWSEPTRWWPRLVRIVFLRPAEPGGANSYVWPDSTFLVIGSARGANR
ncbi:hypothetical protein [Micromonospora sagamiensis]|uniref:Uncharacterized protein n=1 Tax=Micromonospora sagamiensis TaxID=47875 RepID=A0A562WI30_9ACTN|nr:hypothetical protein [Micromonospora sagamiensis]TWJ29798.1 hypothetical protein JD81_03329 [Micromonospora sagamiensis]BCL17174.1 hypothetical protein GCM10017556_49130 [Micromonospora sagamiensis]